MEAETGEVLLAHVDGGKDATDDHKNTADAIVASDKN